MSGPCHPAAECSCQAVEDLRQTVHQHAIQLSEHEERLSRGNVQFAVISTKLNIIMAVLSVVGIAVCSAVISIIL